MAKNKNSKTCLKRPLKKKTKNWFYDRLSLNAGQKYCREHSAILLTFIKLPFVFKTFVLSIFEWPLKTGFTVLWGSLEASSRDASNEPTTLCFLLEIFKIMQNEYR